MSNSMSLKTVAVVLTLSAISLAASANHDPNLDPKKSEKNGKFVIEPFVGMGKLHFGMSREEMIKILGEPQGTSNAPNINDYTKLGLTVVLRENVVWGIFCGDKSKPDSDLIKNCRCKTTKGIGMGSTKQQIVAAYGEPTRIVPDNGLTMMLYKNIAMNFSLRDDKVVYMGAQMPPKLDKKSDAK
jgi:hypothetical protein